MSSENKNDNVKKTVANEPVTEPNLVTLKQVDNKNNFTYAILQETNGEEYESWLYFIKYQGNEDALADLKRQLEMVDWSMDDDLSCFDLETDYLVSEQTAKEMTKVDLNHCSFHRKFDGKLNKINLGFKNGQSDSKKIKKAFKVLGYGKIENFIDQEDIDPEDLNDSDCSDSNSDSNSDCSSDSNSESSSESESEIVETKHGKQDIHKNKKGIIPTISTKIEIPRFAKAKESKAKAEKVKNKK